jgi:two-component system OmpR family response regulator
MLTARDAVRDRVRGLDSAADDYLTKPFALAELFARVRALTRRDPLERPVVLRVGDLTLDPASRVVRRGHEDIALSPKEFTLLQELMRRAGEVLSRTHLIDHVWDFAYDGGSNVVDVYARYLRDKVNRPAATPFAPFGVRVTDSTLTRKPVNLQLHWPRVPFRWAV